MIIYVNISLLDWNIIKLEHQRLRRWFEVLEEIPRFEVKGEILKQVFESLDERIKEDIIRNKLRIYISPPLKKRYEK